MGNFLLSKDSHKEDKCDEKFVHFIYDSGLICSDKYDILVLDFA